MTAFRYFVRLKASIIRLSDQPALRLTHGKRAALPSWFGQRPGFFHVIQLYACWSYTNPHKVE